MKWLLIFGLLLPIPRLFSQERYSILIDEIMADPNPSAGLPPNEWIELRNNSSHPINLSGWRMSDRSGSSGAFPSFLLMPDSFVILGNAATATAMAIYGHSIAVTGFPSLDNEADLLSLVSPDGNNIHAIAYSSGWYDNALKEQGGWSLEMIDPGNPCTGSSNWKASISPNGGTPGKLNSIDAINPDRTAPFVQQGYSIDPFTIVLQFNEPVDSLNASSLSNFSIDGGVSLAGIIAVPPLFDQLQLTCNSAMIENKIYHITINPLSDCRQNKSMVTTIRTALPVDPQPRDIVINEILFNPRPEGDDYVELYNRDSSIVDASKLFLANRNAAGTISSIEQLTSTPFLLFPGEYLLVTENAVSLSNQFYVKEPDRVKIIHQLPSLPDDQGDIVLLNFQGTAIDEVAYDEHWHFKLINDPEGIALERLDPAALSNNSSNWHSAAASSGYGTPGYQNSQFHEPPASNTAISISPPTFSPDNDGFNDICSVIYQSTRPGHLANIRIFNASGRQVRTLVNNGIMGLEGYWNWDGLDERGQQLPMGIYIILSNLFDLEGKQSSFRNVVVLARKL